MVLLLWFFNYSSVYDLGSNMEITVPSWI